MVGASADAGCCAWTATRYPSNDIEGQALAVRNDPPPEAPVINLAAIKLLFHYQL